MDRQAISAVFARLGCHLMLCDIDAGALVQTRDEIAESGRRSATLCFNPGDEIACENAVSDARETSRGRYCTSMAVS